MSPATNGQTIDERIRRMSVEEKVGQLMIWTYAGTELTPATKRLFAKYQPGALIAFSRNIKSIPQIARFNAEAQKFAAYNMKAPFFLMVDQEGGSVTRVRVGTPIPSALAVSKADDAKYIEEFARSSAELLKAIGFNVNLAPVMDLSDPTADTFIANRSFGDDPEQVARAATAYARGIASAGLIPTAKHFPGHGGPVEDSHTTSPKKLASAEELERRDLIPFAQFAKSDFPKALMMAHIALPNIDDTGLPATYSDVIITELLRGKMGYRGLVITDDLEMGGASISNDIGERAVRAFVAGNDMLMLAGAPSNQKRAYEALLAAVKSGRISKSRLDESVRRIFEAKDRPKFASTIIDLKRSAEIKTRVEKLSKDVMQKNFKDAMESKSTQWPQIRRGDHILVMSADRRFYNNFREHSNGHTKFQLLSPGTMDQAQSELIRNKYSLIVFYASGSKTAKWLLGLTPEIRAKILIVNCNHPGEIESQDTFFSVLNLNSHSSESGAWLAKALNEPPPLQEIRTPAAEAKEDNPE